MTECCKAPPSSPMDLDVPLEEGDLFLMAGHELSAPNYLDVDFKELSNRSESTSTPFIPRSTGIKKRPVSPSSMQSDNDSGFCTETSVVSCYGSSIMSNTTNTPSILIGNKDLPSAFILPRLTMDALSDSRSDTDSAYEEDSICSNSSSCAFLDSLSSTPDSNAMDVVFQALDLNSSSGFSSHTSSCYSSQEDLDMILPTVFDDQPMSSESESSCESQVSVVEVSCIKLEQLLPNFSRTLAHKLIGRKMGVEQVNIITELQSRSMTTCLKLIFGHLSAYDLFRASTVSRSWHSAVQDDHDSRLRVKQYFQTLHTPIQKENRCSRGKESSVRPVRGLVDRQAEPLSIIQYSTPEVTPLTEPSSKYQQFQKEASKLHNDESLRKCPLCTHPAKAHSVQERAVCMNQQCAFDFCIRCFCTYHGSKDCAQSSNKKLKTESKIGSKKSKRNLRRL